jgi:hypothetical protein
MTNVTPRPGRNEPCPCGSGRKYKQCCLDKDEAAAREARAKAAAEAAAEAPVPAPDAAPTTSAPTRPRTYQPWKKSATNTHGFQRMSTPRKVGGG